jgi:hypothetical protein
VGSDLSEKGSAIVLDGKFRVAFRETQIERSSAVDARVAALTSRKAVDQPGKVLQVAGVKDSQL